MMGIIMKTKRLIFVVLAAAFLLIPLSVKAQYVYGTTGLLHAPSADMQRDKTFMCGFSYLQIAATPKHWNYDTWNYYINITIFPWLEVGYTCTLHKIGLSGYPYKFRNQDRQFSGRLRVWKEGWWKEWTPQIVIGANDPSTNDVLGDPDKDDYGFTGTSSVGNGHWNRYYVAATKHFGVGNVGELGVHLGYVYNKRRDYHRNGPVAGVNFQFGLPAVSFWNKAVNGLNVIAEYDSHSVNCGIGYNFWKDYISGVVELTGCRYPSAGMVFRVHLK